MTKLAVCLLLLALPLTAVAARDRDTGGARVTLVYEHVLPNVPGKSIKGALVEYAPGGRSPAHVHAPSAFIYATVIEGSVRSRVNEGPARVYRAGESFSELPGDRHAVSANASATRPAKLLAVFVVDSDEAPLTRPLAAAESAPGR